MESGCGHGCHVAVAKIKKMSDAILNSMKTEFNVSSFQKTIFDELQRRGDKGKHITDALLHANSSDDVDIRNTQIAIVQLLVNKAENCNFYDEDKRTVLHYAARAGWMEIVRSLLQKGADPNVVDVFGYSPLLLACKYVQRDIVELLIESGADIFCSENGDRTLLHLTAINGWLDLAQFLVEKGVDPNATSIDGFTPLHFAVFGSHKDMVALLISSGANVHSSSAEEWCTALHLAANRSSLEIVRCLVESEADPNACMVYGYTPLLFATVQSRKDMVTLLIEYGANVDSFSTPERFTVLHIAAGNGLLEIVQCLVENGADQDVRNGYGQSPFDIAASCKKFEILEYLVTANNIKDGRDDTPLNVIIRKRPYALELIRLYIERGAYLTFTDYCTFLNNPWLKEGILKNVQICTQAIVNKFNNKDLPALYRTAVLVDKLPPVEQMIIISHRMIQDIEQDVRKEIETSGHCNVMKPRTIALRMISVQSYLKRLVKIDAHEYPKYS